MLVKVDVTKEHIQRLRGTKPIDAIVELVWNSFDAEATNVRVQIHRNIMDGIDHVSIEDNGSGIDTSEIKTTFGKLGKSKKTTLLQNARGKKFHGSLGEGRFKAYALGNQIEWLTTLNGTALKRIHASYEEADKFEVDDTDKNSLSIKKGTIFKAYNGYEEKISISDNDLAIKLSNIFAPMLIADKDLTLEINGTKVEPLEFIKDELDGILSDNITKYKIYVWNSGKSESGYWCNSGFLVKKEFKVDQVSTHHSFSVFIESPEVDKCVKDGTIDADGLTKLNELKLDVIDILIKFLAKIDKEKIVQTVRILKDSDLYPFKGEPSGEIDKIERKVFDLCVTKVVSAIPNFASGSKEKQKFAFHLLRTAIESSPTSVQHIFEDILKLPSEEIDQLSKILKKYSVAGLIQLGKLIADRKSCLHAIEELVYDQNFRRNLRERKHLHKIIENETWIFDEQFSLGTSDKSLETVLESHKSLLNIQTDEHHYEERPSEKVLIPDLVLGRQYRIGEADRYHHLVIELKRPKVKIGMKEKNQIEEYASEIALDNRFDKEKTKWTFIAVSSQIDPKVERLYKGEDGWIAGNDNFKVYVRTWGNILQAAKGRMQHLWDKSQLTHGSEEGLKYLEEQHRTVFSQIKEMKK